MTSLIEVMGNILVITIVVITKGNGTITQAIFYSIVLPHSFLMNTSHNKNRIITHGWTNVLKNLFGISKKSVDPEEQEPKNGIYKEENKNVQPSESKEIKVRVEVSNESNLKSNNVTINSSDNKETSEKVPNHEDKINVSQTRHILDSPMRKNHNTVRHGTPLNVVDLEKLGEQHSTLVNLNNKKDTPEDTLKLAVKRVEFFSSIDKKTVTTANLERKSELIFTFN